MLVQYRSKCGGFFILVIFLKGQNNILDSRKVSWLDFFILYVQVPAKSRIGYQSPGATGSCVLPNMSAGNWTLEE